jgi:malto-oligosyltrehalose trehalohydrolase
MPTTHRLDMPFGAQVLAGKRGVRFRFYAPGNESAALVYDSGSGERRAALEPRGAGWFETTRDDAGAGTLYRFDVAGLLVPDPASRYQPKGVHGPSAVVDPAAFSWPQDGWRGLVWNEHVFYELHVGTFTPDGTYAAAQTKLDHLVALGVTAIELMPLAEAPGTRNWGYDGVLPFAPSHNYGTPGELKAFVAAAHAHGLAVYLDVVYNHFGPEGNYLHAYAKPFYTDRFHTPWGSAIDVAGADRAWVRAFFIENALYWLEEYRFDGLRLDAVHEIYDRPERHFLRELARAVGERATHPVNLVLENDANEAGLLHAGYRAQWNDDAHHAAHAAVTGQRDGYYADYAGRAPAMLARTLTSGFAFQGEPSPFRGGAGRGEPSAQCELGSFVTFLQNHDQVGNRPFGERITSLAPEPAVRAVLAVLLLAPSPPLLFMGEEWAASTPFLFFCDFEPELARKVTAGRRSEFGSFAAFSAPAERERIPDPSAPETFEMSKLRWEESARTRHAAWLAYYTQLLRLRREEIAPRIAGVRGDAAGFETIGATGIRAHWRLADGSCLLLEANLGPNAARGFEPAAAVRVLFAAPPDAFGEEDAAPWSVRWTLA